MKITVTIEKKIFGRLIKKTASVELPDMEYILPDVDIDAIDIEQDKIKKTVESLMKNLSK
jgi:hypothetical protein